MFAHDRTARQSPRKRDCSAENGGHINYSIVNTLTSSTNNNIVNDIMVNEIYDGGFIDQFIVKNL